jgi:xanthine dehydrogenase accessory factor
MFVTGAAHISQALAPMAQIMGYEVIVADPRGAFVSEKRFPMLRRGVNLHDAWPADVLQEHAPDARTAIICLTHDPKIDDPVLEAAVKSQAFYIGALGSKRTHAKRVERLKLSAFSDPEIDRIHGPIGLDIDAKSPAEIALSILAEATACLRRPAWSIRRCE